jgi:PucR C-terminal helix-turn-helix domain/GGDEF-like domain
MASPGIDTQVQQIGVVLLSRVDELSCQVTASVKANVDFYRTTTVVSDDELLESTTQNLAFLFRGLQTGAPFDTSPAVTTGSKRAAAGVPLPAVMDAFRVATHHIWDVMAQIANAQPPSSREALVRATTMMWNAQDVYTDAMAASHRAQAMQQALEDEAERSALTEALLQARISDDRSLWEVAQLLRIPQKGPYVVVAAKCPAVGKQALPLIEPMLRSIDIFSAWRLLPDLHIGIAQIPSDTEHEALVALLQRQATTRVGVSPQYDNLADTAQALRFARVAANARRASPSGVTVFGDSPLAVAAVSAPEVTNKLAKIILGPFGDLSTDERDVLLDTFRAWVDNNGSVTDAAAQLYCHPNTVRYRLRRVEERTGRSLSVPRELAELCLAVEIYQDSW